MNKKQIFLWTLYDFSNSIAVVVFFLYFSQWLVVEKGVGDIWYNLLFTGSSILLIFTSPILGIIADKKGTRMPYLRFMTLAFFLTCLACSLLAIFSKNNFGFVVASAIFYMLAVYFYQFSFSFYNPLLDEIAPAEKQGRISGLGQMANWLGSIAGIVLVFPILNGGIKIFNASPRAATLLPATLVFFLLSLPMLLWFKEIKKTSTETASYRHEIKNLWLNFIKLCKIPGLGRYLLAFFFFNDAILTAQNNFPIFMEQVFKVSDQTKTMLLGGILITSAFGAFIAGFVADKVGLKKTLLAILIGWVILFPALGLLKNFNVFVGLTIFMGLLYGGTWTVTRAVMVDLAPKDALNHAFSYYTLAERFATFVGPVTWGLITTLLINKGPIRYQIAVLSLAVFVIIGLWLSKNIKLNTGVDSK